MEVMQNQGGVRKMKENEERKKIKQIDKKRKDGKKKIIKKMPLDKNTSTHV